jgi:hypothetical protein
MRFRLTCALILSLGSASLYAQEQDSASRADEIQAGRTQKEQNLHPEGSTPAERRFTFVKGLAERLFQTGNPQLQLGGLPSGSGFAIGPVFQWNNSTDLVRANFTAIGSTNRYYRLQSGIEFPKFARGPSVSLYGAHAYYPSLNYYGSGPNSNPSNRTDYLEEDTTGNLVVRWHMAQQHIIMSAEGGGLLVNVGPGQQNGIPSTQTKFNPIEAPGIDTQTNYLRGAYSLDFDFRDSRDDPHKGGRLVTRFKRYADIKKERYSFGQVLADAEYYLPFFNEKRVIVLHARTELSRPDHNNSVPFYLQPILGEHVDSLRDGESGNFRGYPWFRYRDNNLLLLNAEYRWEIGQAFETALFVDSGRVFPEVHNIGLSHLRNSAGFGFRFKNRDRVVVRIDTGFSNEGFQTWLKFGSPF